MFDKTIIKVSGLSCAHCENRVVEAVGGLEGVKSCKANAKKGEVIISCNKEQAVIARAKQAIVEAGYQVV